MPPPLEEAAQLVPAWVPWAPLLYLPLLALVSFCCARANAWWMLRPLRKLDDAHWTEWNRFAFAARMVSASTMLAQVLAGVVLATAFTGPLSRVPLTWMVVLSGIAAATPAMAVLRGVQRRTKGPTVSAAGQLRSMAVLTLIFFPNWTIALTAMLLAPGRFNAWMALFIPVVAALMVGAFRGGGVWLARVTRLLKPAELPLRALVSRVEERMDVRSRAIYLMPLAMVNAAVVQAPRVLLFTPLMVEHFSDEELEAVTAHELAHLTEPASVVLIRMLSLPLCLVVACTTPVIVTFGLPVYLGAIVAGLLILIYVQRLARRMEQRADSAAGAQAEDPQAYARALEHLTRRNGMPAVGRSKRAVHPDLYDRMLAVGVTPDYPRPAPPPRSGQFLPLLSLVGSILLLLAVWAIPIVLGRSASRTSVASSLELGWMPGGRQLGELGWDAFDQGDPERAAIFYRAAAMDERRDAGYPADAAICLADLGRLEEAQSALRIARRRLRRYESRNGAAQRKALREAIRAVQLAEQRRNGGAARATPSRNTE